MKESGFMQLYKNTDFHEYVEKYARKFSGRAHIREEYEQEAWLAISQAPDSLDASELKEIARKMIRSAYHQQNKNRLVLNSLQDALPGEHIHNGSLLYQHEEIYDGLNEDFCDEQAWKK